MEIIIKKYLEYNIGIDIGDQLITILLNKNVSIPSTNTISFSVSNINKNYIFDLYCGTNILSKNCSFIDCINICSPEKVIYIESTVDPMMFLIIKISTKTKLLLCRIYCLNLVIKDTKIVDEEMIDITNYKLKFELKQCINLIEEKIERNELILDSDTILILNEKIILINKMIDTLSNQKLLDIKTNLKNKFFI